MAEINVALLVSPAAPATPKGKTKGRKTTPSPEALSASKSIILGTFPSTDNVVRIQDSPVLARCGQIFPSGQALIERRFPIKTSHAHPDPPVCEAQIPEAPPVRHLILPFNLKDDRGAFFNEDNDNVLRNLFPGTKGLVFGDFYLIFWVDHLPPQPWPITVAGIRPYFTIDPNDDGPMPPVKRTSKFRMRIADDIDAKNRSGALIDEAFQLVKTFFSEAHIFITEIQYWDEFFVIVLLDESVDLTKIPRWIAKCPCYYLYESEMGRPAFGKFAAKRNRDPSIDVVDNSEYDLLRPGIMLSSGRDAETQTEFLTSSGVLVKDRIGLEYMTVASHGFPHGDKVFHPSATGTEVGQVIMEITHTDVALVRLHSQFSFENETFESTVDGAGPVRLSGFKPSLDMKIGQTIYMNNPFSGYSEGVCGPASDYCVPSDDPNVPSLNWVRTRWVYMGQGYQDKLEDGVCGSAIWDDDGAVIGFFRYGFSSGHFTDWCVSIASENFISKGFTVTSSVRSNTA